MLKNRCLRMEDEKSESIFPTGNFSHGNIADIPKQYENIWKCV